MWISPGFEKSIAHCLIKRHCLQARKEVQGIKLLKELYHFPETDSINLWMTGETGRGQPGIKGTEYCHSASLLWAHTFPHALHTGFTRSLAHTAVLFTGVWSDFFFRSHPYHPVLLVSNDAHILSSSFWLYNSSYAFVCSVLVHVKVKPSWCQIYLLSFNLESCVALSSPLIPTSSRIR